MSITTTVLQQERQSAIEEINRQPEYEQRLQEAEADIAAHESEYAGMKLGNGTVEQGFRPNTPTEFTDAAENARFALLHIERLKQRVSDIDALLAAPQQIEAARQALKQARENLQFERDNKANIDRKADELQASIQQLEASIAETVSAQAKEQALALLEGKKVKACTSASNIREEIESKKATQAALQEFIEQAETAVETAEAAFSTALRSYRKTRTDCIMIQYLDAFKTFLVSLHTMAAASALSGGGFNVYEHTIRLDGDELRRIKTVMQEEEA